jgi:hypothetical protein
MNISMDDQKWLRVRWHGMQKRCSSKRPEVARNYAERGITVCQEWRDDFFVFAAYVSEHLGLPDRNSGERITLDRIDNDAGYKPGNIRWATYTVNLRNRSCNRVVEYRGETLTIAELADRHGLKYGLLMDRITRYGWSVEKAVATPTQHDRRRTVPYRAKHELIVEWDGKQQTLTQWCEQLGVDRSLVRGRLSRGWSFADAIATQSDKGIASRNKAERFLVDGQSLSIQEISERTGIKAATLRYRLQILRMPMEDALRPTFKIRAQTASLRAARAP